VSLRGTSSYSGTEDVPPRVAAAVEAGRSLGFDKSCRPAHGKLLAVLAGGVGGGRIGETGSGCGVGLAWLASGAAADCEIVSVELDPERAAITRQIFADDPRVSVLADDWRALEAHAPFDLLILDGGGQGKRAGEAPIDPDQWLAPGGLLVMDDFTPSLHWPPMHDGKIDAARLLWLEHASLLTTEIRTEPDCATLIAMRRP
jgi:predicted O-methyltransferase YrrM